jgi:hypothetical protein
MSNKDGPEDYRSTALPAGTMAPEFTLPSAPGKGVLKLTNWLVMARYLERLMARLVACVRAARVWEDLRRGARSGVNGTPTFLINGQRYDCDPNLDELLSALLWRPPFEHAEDPGRPCSRRGGHHA